MATIRAFRAFRYRYDESRTIEDTIAPPYDVISPEEAEELRSSPENIVHLTLPTDSSSRSKYDQAATLLRDWIEQSVLYQEDAPCLYRYEQRFEHPTSGDVLVRSGFITRLQLVEFGSGGVHPHERTLSKHREDRFRLRKATGADLEPIFGMYPGDDLVPVLQRASAESPIASVSTPDGVRHSLWAVDLPEAVDQVVAELQEREIFIVDGHHRYTTALRHRREEGFPDDHPLASIMIFLSSMQDPGLVILPTHRIVHSIAEDRLESAREELPEFFELEERGSIEEAFRELGDRRESGLYAFSWDEETFLARPRQSARDLVAGSYPGVSPVARLDITLLHELVFRHLLGISSESQEKGENIRYSRDDTEAIAAARQEDVQIVVGMQAPSIAEVEAVARAGEVMPQKSTYFYPKLASGLLLSVDRDYPRPEIER